MPAKPKFRFATREERLNPPHVAMEEALTQLQLTTPLSPYAQRKLAQYKAKREKTENANKRQRTLKGEQSS